MLPLYTKYVLVSFPQGSTLNIAKLLIGPACNSSTAKHEYPPPLSPPPLLHTRTDLSAEPLHTKSAIVDKHKIALVCPLRAPTASMPPPPPSQTTTERSHAPEYRTVPSVLNANAFTADLCRSNVATSEIFFALGSFFHTLTVMSAEPV
ncbi:protein JINGUBANG-like [Iris pallida]|uniref:Protein JINGUBANG-like n=1 Tax=Iris pallida TaxID=29817 RepID=A0AAX6DK32_IRIPA|nr:protein JINGUBANG-like [Iris pallida]KAJ6833285.1 protein JINGUBANG-like [Iris pallida]